MAITNAARVGTALELLQQGLKPFVAQEMNAVYKGEWHEAARQHVNANSIQETSKGKPDYDVLGLLNIMWQEWHDVFGRTLGTVERSWVAELKEVRHNWAHNEAFSTDDAQRALDTIERMLKAVSASEQAQQVNESRQQLLHESFRSQARTEVKRQQTQLPETGEASGLRPWREVVTPHPDVASGRYQQAEFVADLGQVHQQRAASEYQDPAEFFARTFFTGGLSKLLVQAAERLTDSGGTPVVKLQTNFGGGKTHALISLYHLLSGLRPSEMPGVEEILAESGIDKLPKVQRAVIVGHQLAPGQPHKKPDGTVVNTMWGEIAWQLGGADAYELVRQADESGTSPGQALYDVLELHAPCMILIDEWVAHARQLYGKEDLPAGTFDSHFTFAQALTEAVRAIPGTLLVATIPASDIEKGGQAGVDATERLEKVFGRIESPWRPATAQEGFEIVRRRLFEPIKGKEAFAARDAVVKAFSDTYQQHKQDVPAEAAEPAYRKRMESAYPMHPELFDRLYNDWSSLEKFQRTRGVLRLMAAVIHVLWESQDKSLMIMPGSMPIDASSVQGELTSYMSEQWAPVIENDVDGPNSLPMKLDQDNPGFGRISACRRVARALYLGSAPRLHSDNKGIDDTHVKLGCVQPGEGPATFGDALRRLANEGTYIYRDQARYWYSPVPSVNRLAKELAAQYDEEDVLVEIRGRLREAATNRGDFVKVHTCPATGGDVPDERDARLVIIDPRHPHTSKSEQSKACLEAQRILDKRGNSPRIYRNSLAFLAPDIARLEELLLAVRDWLAWKEIYSERETRNLDAFQTNLAKTRQEEANAAVDHRIPEAYHWLIVPTHSDTTGEAEWRHMRLQGDPPLAVRASKKMINDELLVPKLAGVRLRMEIDRVPLWPEDKDHVSIKQLAEFFAQYLYLSRLKSSNVILRAVEDGINNMAWELETFAYADGYDDEKGRYLGLTAGELKNLSGDMGGLIVKSEVAAAQFEAYKQATDTDEKPLEPTGTRTDDPTGTGTVTAGGQRKLDGTELEGEIGPKKLCRFHASKQVDAVRFGRDTSQIADEVIQHLAALAGASVEVTVEIRATCTDGFEDALIRTISENCSTLRFDHSEFEEE